MDDLDAKEVAIAHEMGIEAAEDRLVALRTAAERALSAYVWFVQHPGAPIAGSASLDARMVELEAAIRVAGSDYRAPEPMTPPETHPAP